MKWRTDRFRSALKILFELRREFAQVEGDAKILLYRVDMESDGIAVIGSFAHDVNAGGGFDAPNELREFAIAVESHTAKGDLRRNTGVAIWVGDQALCRAMGMPIDDKPNVVRFTDYDQALDFVKALMEAEAAFISLRKSQEE